MIATKEPMKHTKIPPNISVDMPENTKIANAIKVKIYIAPVIMQHKVFLSMAITAAINAPIVADKNCVMSFRIVAESSFNLPLDITVAATAEQINDVTIARPVPTQADGSNPIFCTVLLFFNNQIPSPFYKSYSYNGIKIPRHKNLCQGGSF